MTHFNATKKNPPWVRSNVQQQPLLTQQMTVQSVALSQPLTTTHLAQNQINQVQITPAIQGQVQLPLTQAHLSLNQQLTPTFGQVQINQAQLANIATIHQHQGQTQTYFTPSISLQQNVGLPQGTIQIQPSSVVIPTSMSTSIAPPGLAIPTTLATVQNSTAAYNLSRISTAPPPLPPQPTVKQRVFSGTVTKLHENFGFIDEDVIFQNSCVKGFMPQVGDRVLVEASYNGTMPFKWSATRVQVIAPPQSPQQLQKIQLTPSVCNTMDMGKQTLRDWLDIGKQAVRDWSLHGRSVGNDYRESGRSTPKNRESRARDRRSRSPSRSPSHKRSRSPPTSPRRRSRNVPRYSVQVPKVSLDCRGANVIELRRRYNHMYVPSDFVSSVFWWVKSLPSQRPLPLDRPVPFHIFSKDVDPPEANTSVYDPSDADYSYSAKVMLLSLPPIDELVRKCCPEEDKEDFVHPARLIQFLVGIRGKNETTAIGGPWSPSLDGSDPKGDPQVLIRTAIRTCKALTGIDLSPCTQWYRVAEIQYHRVSSLKNRIESVLLFVPDVWSCIPTTSQWETIVESYLRLADDKEAEIKVELVEDAEENEVVDVSREATHFSKLEPRSMKADELRNELEARNMNCKGLRTQLISRLTIAVKAESEEEKRKVNDTAINDDTPDCEQEDARHLDFAATPKILVHPSRTAKGGKFNCSLVSLSVLLDYRLEDAKEHTFEVSLFSELFNEMLMRDFGMLIYKAVSCEGCRKEKREKKEDEDSDRKRRAKLCNAPLQLAFSYFDLNHCNYILGKDLEDLFLTLGAHISRAQVHKLIQKVTTDDTLRYKKLLDTPMKKEDDDMDVLSVLDVHKDTPLEPATVQNNSSSLVLVNGCYVNVEQLLLRLEQSEDLKAEIDNQFKLSQSQLLECRKSLSKMTENASALTHQLAKEKRQLELTKGQLDRAQDCLGRYVQGVGEIQSLANTLLVANSDDRKVTGQEVAGSVIN